MRIATVVAVLLTLLPASAGALPSLLTQAPHRPPFAVRPAQIVYTGDGSGILGGFTGRGPLPRFGSLKWSSWTRNQALGSGAVWLDDCEPSCAGGKFDPYAVRVHAFDPVAGHFRRLTLRYAYEGKEVVDRRGLERIGGSYAYYIITSPD
jgi:hypothetical protein